MNNKLKIEPENMELWGDKQQINKYKDWWHLCLYIQYQNIGGLP